MTELTLRDQIEALPRHKLVRHGPEYQDMMMVRPDGGWLSRAEVLRILDAHTAPDAVAEAADIDAAYKDGWGFAYRQWQRTGSVPDPEYTLKGNQP